MKIEKNEIANKLKKLKSIAASNLSNKVVLVDGNILKAYSPEMQATYELNVNSDEKFIIPLSVIDVIDSMPNGEIEITGTDKRIKLVSQGIKSSFPTNAVSDFTDFDTSEDVSTLFTYDGEIITEAINKTIYICTPSIARPIMSGLYFESDGNVLNIVSCDGFRCAWNKVNYCDKLKAVIPKAALQKVLSLGLDKEMKILSSGKNKIVFKSGQFSLYARLLEGNYVEYRNFFEAEKPTQFTVNKVEMYNATARIIKCLSGNTIESILIEGTENGLKVSLHNSENNLEEDVALVDGSAEGVKFALKPSYLYEALKYSEEDNVTFKVKDEKNGVIIDDGDTKALIMPMRL